MSAPYEVNILTTDDETFSFVLPFTNDDSTDFAFGLYAVEYSVTRRDCGSSVLSLTQGNGITIQSPNVTFRKPDGGSLQRGEYEHGCRVRLLSTGDTTQVFDGVIRVDEGHF